MSGNSNWQFIPPFGVGVAGSVEHSGPDVFFRDDFDAYRSAWNRTPEAQYPDGYLGTVRSRRDDRLLNAVKTRENQRNYQRGVHKGERIDTADYLWPPEFNPSSGIERQLTTGLRHTPLGGGVEVLAHDGKVSRAAIGLMEVNHLDAEQYRHLRPTWA